MHQKKYDSFSPKRATNIDGFIAKPAANRPRQPVFRASSAASQQGAATLIDMPKRQQPQAVLAGTAPAVKATPAYPAPGERRRKRLADETPVEEQSRRWGRHKDKQPRSWKRGFRKAAAIIGTLVLLVGLWCGFKIYKDIAKLTGNKNPLSLLGVFHPVPLKNQDGRVNILVAANSADDVGHNGANLTD